MKASLAWLRSLVPGLTASADEVAHRLTGVGLEVEAAHRFGDGLERIVVAAVLDCQPHPSRSSLQIVRVDDGSGTPRSVVCGAPNVPAAGKLVCLAPPGARVHAPAAVVERRAIAGVESDGMLCSEAELGISDDASGLLVLPDGTASPGTPLPQAVPACTDVIFEIGVTPNRPDALGHIGIARDLAAVYGLSFRVPEPDSPLRVSNETIDQLVMIEVQDFERCPHYGALAVDEVTIEPSPLWVRLRLHSLGVRPVSNIVDITNLVLLEYGHPMHAFDLDLLRGGKIIVRRARPNEKMITLDGVERVLDPDDLLICDAEGPVALGGIMGGQNTEIRASTKRVLFECAYFDPRGIRRSSRRHGLHSESSHRFERGVNQNDAEDVLAHAGSLSTRLAGGRAVRGSIQAAREPWMPTQLVLRHQTITRLLGVEVPLNEARTILERLGFDPKELRTEGGFGLQVSVPSHRPDVSREADLVEEIARIRGLDAIPTQLPRFQPQRPRTTHALEDSVRRTAVELGLSEAITFGFVSPEQLELVGAPAAAVRLLNPLTEDRSVMRSSLLPGLLEAASRARRHGERSVKLFTVGAIFLTPGADAPLPHERLSFAALLAGSRDVYLGRPQEIDVYDAKGIAVEMVRRVSRHQNVVVEPLVGDAAPGRLHPKAAARITINGVQVATFGMLHPNICDAVDIARSAAIIELDLEALQAQGQPTASYRAIPRVPAATRDVALIVGDEVNAGDVQQLIRDAAGELCESIELFDVFRGGSVPKGHRSLAYHVVYRDPRATTDPDKARTLTDQEVDERHSQVVSNAEAQLQARLR